MLFEVGETVVYPHHGAATIIEVKDRIIKGETKKYLKLNVTQGDLIIEVPADNVDLVGKYRNFRCYFWWWRCLLCDRNHVLYFHYCILRFKNSCLLFFCGPVESSQNDN